MIYSINPDMLQGIPDTFLPLKYVGEEGPIIVAVEKSAIHFDPPGTSPETEAEWDVVRESLGKTLEPLVLKLLPHHDKTRTTGSGTRWRHLDLTATLLTANGVEPRTMAHYMLRQASGAFQSAP
jgi:hypothetical protein